MAFGCIQAPQTQAPAQPGLVCNSPYIQVGAECCLDANSNKICDKDEPAPKAPDAPLTPPDEGVKCELPYILVGSDCCLDANSNKICDKDEVQVKTCPTDVQACPGGSNVSRNPDNNCNFYSCPAVLPQPEIPNASNSTNASNNTSGTWRPLIPHLNITFPMLACNSSPVLSAITSNLMDKSNECRSTRVSVLCNACSTCCSAPGVDKTEYAQSLDPTCYTCATANFGVARARDYYDRMGTYEHICTENCNSLVSAYKAYLQYGKDYHCALSDGWKICSDVTLG